MINKGLILLCSIITLAYCELNVKTNINVPHLIAAKNGEIILDETNSSKSGAVYAKPNVTSELDESFAEEEPPEFHLLWLGGYGRPQSPDTKDEEDSVTFLDTLKEDFKKLSPYYLPDPNMKGISKECSRDVKLMRNVILPLPRWARIMVDSWGKAKDGRMYGTIFLGYVFPGVMDECLGVFMNSTDAPFDGKYCMVDTKYTIKPYKYGTCMPSSCTESELQDSVREEFHKKGWFSPDNGELTVHCQMKQFEMKWGTWEIVGSAIILDLILLVLIATVSDILYPEKTSVFLKSFSASQNLSKIFAVRTGSSREITCFHAIRVLSICWVILGHQYVTIFMAISNIKHLFQMTTEWTFQIVTSGYRAVDTFFFLGGILLTKSLLTTSFCSREQNRSTPIRRTDAESVAVIGGEEDSQTYAEHSRIAQSRTSSYGVSVSIFIAKYAYYIFHRVMRTWPSIMVSILFFAGPATLFLSGPLTFLYDTYLHKCRESWWWDLTFINNFLMRNAAFTGNGKGSCLGNTWYLAVDMQVYLVMPFLILPVKRMKYKQTYLWILTLISCIIPAAIVMGRGLIPSNLLGATGDESLQYQYRVYFMPYTRATPYFVGALCAYWLTLVEKSGKTGRELMNNFYKKHPAIASLHPRLLGWIIITITALAVVFGQLDYNYVGTYSPKIPDPRHITPTESFFYSFLAIFAWSVVVGWVVMMCSLGLAEPLNFFLSHPMWQPFSRLTFGAFLISLSLQMMLPATFQEYIYLTWNMLFYTICGVVVLSYGGSLLLSLLVEAPVISLMKILKEKSK